MEPIEQTPADGTKGTVARVTIRGISPLWLSFGPPMTPPIIAPSRQETDMQKSVATVTIVGITPLSQSREHDEPMLEAESHGDYDRRTWRCKLNTREIEGRRTVVLPAHGVQQAIAAAAKYSKRQIKGQGKATWTQKFLSGIALLEDPSLNIDPESVGSITISANADGVRGSGKRVRRKFPQMLEWGSTFDVVILDPIITETIFTEMLSLAGLFIGFGRFRPEKGGINGRFTVDRVEWDDQRELLKIAA
jgi:hypothetical protein